ADTTMPFRSTSTTRRRLRKTFTTSASAHVPENIPAGARVLAAATTIPAGSSVAAAVHVTAAPSSSIPTAADKGKAPMVPAGVPAASSFPADVVVHATTSSAPADISVPVVSHAHAAASVPAKTVVHTVESHLDDTLTASEHVSTEPTVAMPTPSSSRKRRKHIAKKRVTPIEMVPSLLGSVHANHDMAGHTKHFTTLCELLHMVEKTYLQKLLGAVDELYQKEEPDTFALLLWGESLDDDDALDFWRNQDSWRIRSWRLYPPTLERMLKHGLEVPKLLVGGDLTMAKQLIGFIKAALLNAQSAV
nr:hypothetical protein [Tanacetum cinerariifolium]